MKDNISNYIVNEILSGQDQLIAFDEDLLTSGILDSLSVMKLITYIEKEFNVQVSPSEMTVDNFITVNAISIFIQKKLSDNVLKAS